MKAKNSQITQKDVMKVAGFADNEAAYKIFKGMISTWFSKKKHYENLWADPSNRSAKQVGSGRSLSLTDDGEDNLCVRLDIQRKLSRQITGRYIISQANAVAREIGVNFSATRTWLTKFGKRTGFRYYNCTSVKRSDTGLDPVMRTKFENFVLGLVALKAKNHGSEKDAEYGNFVLSQIANLDESPFAFVNAKNLKTWA